MQSCTKSKKTNFRNSKQSIEYQPIYSTFIYSSITSSNSDKKSKLNEKHSEIFFFDTNGERNNYLELGRNNSGFISYEPINNKTNNHQSDSIIVIKDEDEGNESDVPTEYLFDSDSDSSLDTDTNLYGRHDDIIFIDSDDEEDNLLQRNENKRKYDLSELDIKKTIKLDPDSVAVIENGQTQLSSSKIENKKTGLETPAEFNSIVKKLDKINTSIIVNGCNTNAESGFKCSKKRKKVECELKTKKIRPEQEVPEDNDTIEVTERLPSNDLETIKTDEFQQMLQNKDIPSILKILSSCCAIDDQSVPSNNKHCDCCKRTSIRIISESRSSDNSTLTQTSSINVEIDHSFIVDGVLNLSSGPGSDNLQQLLNYMIDYYGRSKKTDKVAAESMGTKINEKDSSSNIDDGKICKKKSVPVGEQSLNKVPKVKKSSTPSDTLQCNNYSQEKPLNDDPPDEFDLNKNTFRDLQDSTMDSNGYVEDVLETGRLEITLPFPVPPLHKHVRMASKPHKEEIEAIVAANCEIKTGMFTAKEDETIKNNWDRFCEDHDLIVDPFYFCEFPKFMNSEERIKFMQYMAHGLDNRLIHSVYRRFQKLFRSPWLKSGRFTQEEDDKIMEIYSTSSKPIKKLAKLLNRDRLSIEKRHDTLMRSKNKVTWDIDMVDKLVNRIMKVAKISNVEDLRDIKLPAKKWTKISKKMDIPVDKLRRAWKVTIHPRFFSKNPVDIMDIKKRIINSLYERNETDWRSLDWKAIAKDYDGFTAQKIYLLFRQTVDYHVPKVHHKDLKECLIFLKKKIEEGDTLRTRRTFGKYVYQDGHVRLESE